MEMEGSRHGCALPPARRRPELPRGPYVVAGLGRAGRAAARRLVAVAGPRAVAAWDGGGPASAIAAARALEREGVRVALGGDGHELLPGAPGCVVKSPGMRPDVPLLREARRRGIAIVDELELGWRLDRRPMVAVTGTNGKSTVAKLSAAVLRAGGVRALPAGNSERAPALSALERDGDAVVCEVSSFQLEGCPTLLPEVALLTNLTHEHLDRHVTMERYGAAKRRLFVRGSACVPVAVVNVDGEFGKAVARDVEARGGAVLRYGEAPDADYRLETCRWTLDSGWLAARTPRGPLELETRLPGRHNALNALAAAALADALGVPRDTAAAAIGATPRVPGRFERIARGQPFDVIVDYAHNPDGIAGTLAAARALTDARSGAQLRVVCSAPRIRDARQRRAMGAAAAALADHLILTTERWPLTDAAFELPAGLERAVRDAGHGWLDVVVDRAEAIEHAVRAADPGDLVMILGRGAGSGALLDRDGRLRRFDDRVAARRALARIEPQRA
jgi:UDP-N-acetylmuramoylalanine-D-glutamate ligase